MSDYPTIAETLNQLVAPEVAYPTLTEALNQGNDYGYQSIKNEDPSDCVVLSVPNSSVDAILDLIKTANQYSTSGEDGPPPAKRMYGGICAEDILDPSALGKESLEKMINLGDPRLLFRPHDKKGLFSEVCIQQFNISSPTKYVICNRAGCKQLLTRAAGSHQKRHAQKTCKARESSMLDLSILSVAAEGLGLKREGGPSGNVPWTKSWRSDWDGVDEQIRLALQAVENKDMMYPTDRATNVTELKDKIEHYKQIRDRLSTSIKAIQSFTEKCQNAEKALSTKVKELEGLNGLFGSASSSSR